jgi:hypothetical protein
MSVIAILGGSFTMGEGVGVISGAAAYLESRVASA